MSSAQPRPSRQQVTGRIGAPVAAARSRRHGTAAHRSATERHDHRRAGLGHVEHQGDSPALAPERAEQPSSRLPRGEDLEALALAGERDHLGDAGGSDRCHDGAEMQAQTERGACRHVPIAEMRKDDHRPRSPTLRCSAPITRKRSSTSAESSGSAHIEFDDHAHVFLVRAACERSRLGVIEVRLQTVMIRRRAHPILAAERRYQAAPTRAAVANAAGRRAHHPA